MSETYTEETIRWAESFGRCWRCGASTLEIHHFVSGSSRKKNNLATTAICCNECHRIEHEVFHKALGLQGWLYLKRMHDPEHYDLAEVCRARGEAVTAITEDDVSGNKTWLQGLGVIE